jgi:hypothetical protein
VRLQSPCSSSRSRSELSKLIIYDFAGNIGWENLNGVLNEIDLAPKWDIQLDILQSRRMSQNIGRIYQGQLLRIKI